jgi:predicted Zn-dependent protease
MKRIALSLLALFCFTSCATSPEGRRQLMTVSDSDMDQAGVQAFTEMKGKESIDADSADNAFVKCVAGAITDALPEKRQWEVVVFKDDQVNAFALPGGKIGVLSGILKVTTTADQLGAVLGHEVGHVLARHSAERASEQQWEQTGLGAISAAFSNPNSASYKVVMGTLGLGTQFGLAMPHSRTQESEADAIGLKLMATAGFDPQQAVELWKNMDKAGGGQGPAWLSDHPSNSQRITDLQARMPNAVALYKASGRHPNCHR